MSDFVPDYGTINITTGTAEEVAAAVAQAEVNLRAAKEAYREDKSEDNRELFHVARDRVVNLRRGIRPQTMSITAEGR